MLSFLAVYVPAHSSQKSSVVKVNLAARTSAAHMGSLPCNRHVVLTKLFDPSKKERPQDDPHREGPDRRS